jgi:beta-N-acetylhexosaminidase
MTDLSAAPFRLDPDARAWVARTRAALDPDAAVAQLFVLGIHGPTAPALERLVALRPGGITRFFSEGRDAEMVFLDALKAALPVPPLVSADLEGSRMSLPFGAQVPNPLALAAIDDVEATREVARIMAEEAAALGVNWSFTPVIDINAAFRSAIVATRGFGSDVARIERHALAMAEVFQAHGIAATVKHWPGEGYDDRDQHLVTTINPLTMPEWEATFGRLYRAAIARGVLAVMSAHIALPAFARERGAAGLEAYRPASISRALNLDLLRGRLGFEGVIVSDASEMAGLTSWGTEGTDKAELIAAGCDVVLFSRDPEGDMAKVKRGLEDGRIGRARFEDALTRVLALKAALGLHRSAMAPPAERQAALGSAANRTAAARITARAPTLVKDVQGLLPLDPVRHRRVLVLSTGVVSPIHGAPRPLVLPRLLAEAGFEVTEKAPGQAVEPRDFDLVLYLLAEETLLTRGRIFLDWLRLEGDFRGAMRRYWTQVPTAMISFGYPYYLYDAPRVPTYINAWATYDGMQDAVRDCLLGRAPWNGQSPVDPFCGLEDARW